MISERGSIAPLAIGLLLMSLATIAVTISASSLFVAQRRLQTLAESVALSNAATGNRASDFILALPTDYAQRFHNLKVAREESLDGVTFEVKLCADWQNPFATLFADAQAPLCAEAKARVSG